VTHLQEKGPIGDITGVADTLEMSQTHSLSYRLAPLLCLVSSTWHVMNFVKGWQMSESIMSWPIFLHFIYREVNLSWLGSLSHWHPKLDQWHKKKKVERHHYEPYIKSSYLRQLTRVFPFKSLRDEYAPLMKLIMKYFSCEGRFSHLYSWYEFETTWNLFARYSIQK